MHMLKHNPVSIDDNVRKYFLAEQNSQQASRDCRQKCIAQIFSCNRMPFISQRLKGSDLCPLLLYHSCHSRQTDQCCHKEEDCREDFADRPHPIRIFSVSAVLRKIGAVIDIPLRFLQILNLLFCIRQFLFCILNLLLSVCDLLSGLCLSFPVLFPAVCYFLLRISQFFLRISQFLFAGFNLLPAGIDLFLPGLQLCLRIFDLRLCLRNSLFPLLNFFIERIHCPDGNRICPAAGGKSVILLLGRIQLIDLTVKRINIGIEFLFSPVQVFLALCKLRSGRLQLLSG